MATNANTGASARQAASVGPAGTSSIVRKPVPVVDESSTYMPLLTRNNQEVSHTDADLPRGRNITERSDNDSSNGHIGTPAHYQQLRQNQPVDDDGGGDGHVDPEEDGYPSSNGVKLQSSVSVKPSRANVAMQGRRLPSSASIGDWWIWEPLGLLVSALAMAGIVGVLAFYNDKQQPRWKHVSINTVISWISTLAKAGVVVPLAASIGQLKWIHQAERSRSLTDLALFDSASRGEIGALRLLFTAPFVNLAKFGAIATVLAVAFDPFNQNLVHVVSGTVEDVGQMSTVSNGSQFQATGPFRGGDAYFLDPVLKANVYNSLLNPNQPETWTTPLYHCPTGNCTWSPMAVLGARALCTNITEHLTRKCGARSDYDGELIQPCTVALPNGVASKYNIGNYAYPIVISANALGDQIKNDVGWPRSGIVYSNHSMLIAQFIMALGSDEQQSGEAGSTINNKTRWIANECSIEPVVRSIQPEVRSAAYRETILDTWTQTAWFANVPKSLESDPVAANLYWGFQPPWGPSEGMHRGKVFGLGYNAYLSAVSSLQDFFTGNVSEGSDTFLFNGDEDIIQSLFYGSFTNCATPSDKLRCAFENLATTLSKSWRDSVFVPGMGLGRNAGGSYGSGSLSASQLDTTMARGTALVSTTFVRVHWYWLCLPLLVWVLALTTWLLTVWMTRRARVPRWRNSLLPLLFLYRGDRDYFDGTEKDEKEAEGRRKGVERGYRASNEAYVRRGEEIKARLVVGEDSARLERVY